MLGFVNEDEEMVMEELEGVDGQFNKSDMQNDTKLSPNVTIANQTTPQTKTTTT